MWEYSRSSRLEAFLRKGVLKILQQIYRRTPLPKRDFNKLSFGMGVLLHINFAACIFSERTFLRIPLDCCF